jgi:hypothetical protein
MGSNTPLQLAKHWRNSCETVRQKSISHRLSSAVSASFLEPGNGGFMASAPESIKPNASGEGFVVVVWAEGWLGNQSVPTRIGFASLISGGVAIVSLISGRMAIVRPV